MVIPRWQLRENGKLIAAALLGRVYTCELASGRIVRVNVSNNLWVTICPGKDVSPELQPRDVMQPGKDSLIFSETFDDLILNDGSSWIKTRMQLHSKT